MAADYSGTCPKPGFWVWSREHQEVFWFHDDWPPETWHRVWEGTHGPGMYVPLVGDSFTPKLFTGQAEIFS